MSTIDIPLVQQFYHVLLATLFVRQCADDNKLAYPDGTNFQNPPKKLTQRTLLKYVLRPSWHVLTYSNSRSHLSSTIVDGQ